MFGAFGAGATAAGRTFGAINDALILVAYVLAVPGVLASAAILRSTRPGLVALSALVALAAIGAIAVLQWQLVTGSLTFEEQIGPVSVAFLALGGWFVISGYLGAGILPYGVGIGALAALYVGYPALAYRLGRSLVASTEEGRHIVAEERDLRHDLGGPLPVAPRVPRPVRLRVPRDPRRVDGSLVAGPSRTRPREAHGVVRTVGQFHDADAGDAACC